MAGKPINPQQLFELIEHKLSSGKQRSEILEELNAVYHDRKTLARYIASVPDGVMRRRFTALNRWLVLLLWVNVANKLTLVMLNVLPSTSLGISTLFIALNIWLALQVRKFRGFAYRITALISVIELLSRISDYLSTTAIGQLVISTNLFVLAVVCVLAMFIGRQVFPFFGVFRVKKNADGQYAW